MEILLVICAWFKDWLTYYGRLFCSALKPPFIYFEIASAFIFMIAKTYTKLGYGDRGDLMAMLQEVSYWIFAVVFLGALISAPYRYHKKIVRQRLDEFYNRNSEARELKAHKVFCSLYMRTRQYYDNKGNLTATEEQIGKWDDDVISDLSEHCHSEAKNMYFNNTGRLDNDGPLTFDYFPRAEKEVFDLAYAKHCLKNRLKPT